MRPSSTAPVFVLIALFAHSGQAIARPGPLLGPTGPTWFGPLPPTAGWDLTEDRGVVVVDPATGAPWVEVTDLRVDGEPDPLILARTFEGGSWRWRGEGLLQVQADGIHVTHQGTRVPSFPPPWNNAMEPFCPAGRELHNGHGDLLRCIEEGYDLLLRDGTTEHYDASGQLTVHGGAGDQSVRWTWADGDLGSLTTDDGRRIEISEAKVVGKRLERVAQDPSGRQVRYEYNEQDQLVSVATDGLHHRYLYDAEGRLEVLLWSDGSRSVLRWDHEGRVRAIEGPGAARWRFEWGEDGLDRAFDGRGMAWQVRRRDGDVSLRDPAGRSATLLTEDGRIRGWKDPAGYTTTIERDDQGRLTSVRPPTGGRWSITTDDHGRLTRLVGPLGSPWRLDYDDDRGLLRITDPTGRVRRFRTDSQGRVVEITEGGTLVSLRRDSAGRVREIHHGTQGTTRIDRDGAGRITAITDAAGGETRFEDHIGDLPSTIQDAGGGTWKLLFDRLARARGLGAPDGSVVEWKRNSAGGLVSLQRGEAKTRLDRRADGTITRIVDPLGRLTGWTRDAIGRVTSWLRPDGSVLMVNRDARGDPQRLKLGDVELEIERDMQGRPVALHQLVPDKRGLLTWVRNLAGQVSAITWPLGELTLDRDAAGRVRAVHLAEDHWKLERDAAGRLIGVQQGELGWSIQRDDAGLPAEVTTPDGTHTIERDPRGLTQHANFFDARITWKRDAAGRTARLTGPGDVSLGIQRDPAGRPVLMRLPDGALLRITWDELTRWLVLEDASGRPIYEGHASYDHLGRMTGAADASGTHHLRYGPFDELLSIEEEHAAWSVFPGRHEGPPGTLVVTTDDRGRPRSAEIEQAAPVWGVARRHLDYALDELGRVERVDGDAGQAILEHDALGRLTAVTITDGAGGSPLASWQVEWDPFGRPTAITSVGERTLLGFLGGRLIAIRERDQTAVLLEEDAVAVMAGVEGHTTLFTGVGGWWELALFAEGAPYEAASTPGGLRDLGYPGILAEGGRLQLFPGGPLIGPADATDPLSGLSTSQVEGLFPWNSQGWPDPDERIAWPTLDGATSTIWDPAPWEPEGPWSDPLALLVALGELELPITTAWWRAAPAAAPLPWMPAGLEGQVPAVLPPEASLPMDESPVASWFLARAMPPTEPGGGDGLPAVILGPELRALPQGWPALHVPGDIPSTFE